MDSLEIRVRLIEAAARHPHSTHQDGHAAGVLAAAQLWFGWVVGVPLAGAPATQPETMREKLGLPKKK